MRLIDADYTEEFVNHFTLFEGKPLTEREKKIVNAVVTTITGMQPTAYDVEEVVKELKQLYGCNEECRKGFYYGMGCMVCMFGQSIEIVRKAGNNDR